MRNENESLESGLLRLVRLAEYSGDKGLIDAAIWALYQAWELREASEIDPETLAMIAKLSMKLPPKITELVTG